jgi:hypothetical protein
MLSWPRENKEQRLKTATLWKGELVIPWAMYFSMQAILEMEKGFSDIAHTPSVILKAKFSALFQ